MSLGDPQAALAEQSSFIGYLLGLAGAARCVRELARCDSLEAAADSPADDLVHLLLGVAGLGAGIWDLVDSPCGRHVSDATPPTTAERWLR